MPKGLPKFLGYVTQQHNIRNSKTGMTMGWNIFGSQVKNAVQENIIDPLFPLGQCENRNNYLLGQIPNLHSLHHRIPYHRFSLTVLLLCDEAPEKSQQSRGLLLYLLLHPDITA